MNKRVMLLSVLIAFVLMGIVFIATETEISGNTMFKDGSAYFSFEYVMITLSEPEYPSASSSQGITHNLRGSPLWFYYQETGNVEATYFSVIPFVINYLILFAISFIVIYALYLSKYKKMLGFKEEKNKPYPAYSPLWNFVEPDYYYGTMNLEKEKFHKGIDKFFREEKNKK